MRRKFFDNLLLGFGTLLLLVVLIASKPSYAMPLYGATASLRQATEYEIKAVYLYNFILFTKWPAETKETKQGKESPKTICIGILGDNPFGDAFKDVEGKRISGKGKKLVIKRYGRYKENKDITDCQMLFVSSSEKKNLKQILRRLSNKPILTVADMSGFIDSGGMVNFVKSGKKIRWEINSTPLKLAGLKLSSQLLRNSMRIIEKPKLSASKNENVAGLDKKKRIRE